MNDRLCLLLEIFADGECVFEFQGPYTAKVTHEDGSISVVYWHHPSKRWEFGNSNMAYDAGYSYAAGYHD